MRDHVEPVPALSGPQYAIAAAVGLALTVGASVAYRYSLLRALSDKREVAPAKEELGRIEDSVKSLDLVTIWSATQARLDYYHQIATKQAERVSGTPSSPP